MRLKQAGKLVSCQASNNGQSGVSFAESLRYKKPYIAMAMRVFCALTFHKIYGRLTHHLRLDTTLVFDQVSVFILVLQCYITLLVVPFGKAVELPVFVKTFLHDIPILVVFFNGTF